MAGIFGGICLQNLLGSIADGICIPNMLVDIVSKGDFVFAISLELYATNLKSLIAVFFINAALRHIECIEQLNLLVGGFC